MAPRALPLLTCFRRAADAPLPEEAAAHGAEKRRWADELKRRIVQAVRRPRRAVREEDDPADVDVEKKHSPERKVAEQQATRPPRRSAGPGLQRESILRDGGAGDEAVAVDGRPKMSGLKKVRFAVPEEETIAAPVEQEQLLFPSGVLGEPPKSFRNSCPEMTVALVLSIAAAEKDGEADSISPVDRWSEAKEKRLRRGRYLRDYCPFQVQSDDEESAPEETALPAEPDHAEVVLPVKTGLPFDSPESEAEFVKAIYSRHLLKDDFINRCAYERSRDKFMREQSLMAVGEDHAVV